MFGDNRRDLVDATQCELQQEALDVFIGQLDPILTELIRARLVGIEPQRSVHRLPHLRAVTTREKRPCEAEGRLLQTLTYQLDASSDVPPLIGTTHLHLDVFVLAQMSKIVRLQQHVRELGVRDAVLALHTGSHRFLGHHLIDREVLADVTQEVEGTHRRSPVRIVDESRSMGSVEVEDFLQLLLHLSDVVSQRLAIEQVAFLTSPAWIAHHSGGSTGEYHRAMSGQLEPAQHHLTEKVARVERIGRRIETDVHPDRSGRQPFAKSRSVSRIVDETACIEIGEQGGFRHRCPFSQAHRYESTNYDCGTVAPVVPGDEKVSETSMALARQAVACRELGSTQYADLLDELVLDTDRGGPIGRLLADRPERPLHSALSLRLLGAVHRIALRGEAPELAARFPSCGGDGSPIPLGDFEDVVHRHRPEIDVELGNQVQTNEVGRSIVPLSFVHWVTTLGVTDLDWIEIGASAGLNLHFEKYGAECESGSLGDPTSTVRFDPSWFVSSPPVVREPATCRRLSGADPFALDVNDSDDSLRLLSFVWPDQIERFERLRAAIGIAATSNIELERRSADHFVQERLADDSSLPRVVFHSIVWQYLSSEVRNGVRDALAGATASRDAPVIWLRMEPSGSAADVRVTVYDGGREPIERRLAEIGYHGRGFRWL